MWTPEETARALLAVLPLINRILVTDLRQEAGEDTTMPQFRVLAHLAEAPLTLSDIARRRRVSLQAAGILVQTLVERGWISRVPDDQDRRQIHLHLTPEGQARFQQVSDRMVAHLTPLMGLLTAEETTAIEITLHALQRVLTREDDSDAD